MATMITSECINCGACEPECPNTAIYQGGVEWEMNGLKHAPLAADAAAGAGLALALAAAAGAADPPAARKRDGTSAPNSTLGCNSRARCNSTASVSGMSGFGMHTSTGHTAAHASWS